MTNCQQPMANDRKESPRFLVILHVLPSLQGHCASLPMLGSARHASFLFRFYRVAIITSQRSGA